MTDMTTERAQEIASELVEGRIRWGNSYRLRDCSAGAAGALDAIVALAKAGNLQDALLRADIAKANRQLGAGKSRETKLKLRITKLQNEIDSLTTARDELGAQNKELQLKFGDVR